MKLLDVGCGPGAIINISYYKHLQKRYDIYGVDFLEKNVMSMKQRFPSGTFRVASAEKLPFPSNEFDAILLRHVLEHIHDVDKAMKQVKRVSKNNAVVFIAVPHPTLEKVMTTFNPYHIRVGHNHERIFTKMSLNRLIEKHGLRVISESNQKWPLFIVNTILGIIGTLTKKITIEEQTGVYMVAGKNYTHKKQTKMFYTLAAKLLLLTNSLLPFFNFFIPFEIEVHAVIKK